MPTRPGWSSPTAVSASGGPSTPGHSGVYTSWFSFQEVGNCALEELAWVTAGAAPSRIWAWCPSPAMTVAALAVRSR